MQQCNKLLRKACPNSAAAELCAAKAEHDVFKARAETYQANATHTTLALNQAFKQLSKEHHVPMNPAGYLPHLSAPTNSTRPM
eukprot:14987701-Ditylum_brightwellii.AAC.1